MGPHPQAHGLRGGKGNSRSPEGSEAGIFRLDPRLGGGVWLEQSRRQRSAELSAETPGGERRVRASLEHPKGLGCINL